MKKVIVILAILAIATAGIVYAIGYSTTSTISAPAGETDTFTVTATLNDVAVASYQTITLPAGLVGSTDTIVYTITTTANQPITITATYALTGGPTAVWSGTSTTSDATPSLAVGAAPVSLTLTVTLGTTSGTVTVYFVATP